MKTMYSYDLATNHELFIQKYLREVRERLEYTNYLIDKEVITGIKIPENRIMDLVLDSIKNSRYKIKVIQSKVYPELYLFKYSQIESPMREPLVQECRGIILNSDDNWNVVSYPFNKFFNIGENLEIEECFDWDNYKVYSKEDGSLVQLYYYKNKWNISTSGNPDAAGNVGDYNIIFNELVQRYLPNDLSFLNTNLTYMFELITLENKNVVRYPQDEFGLYLLGARDIYNFQEYLPEQLNLDRYFNCCIEWKTKDIYKFVDDLKGEDEEGYVLVDKDFNRLKVKSKDYVAKHHLKHSWSLKSAIQVVLNNEIDEIVTYFPEYKGQLERIENNLSQIVNVLYSHYLVCYHFKIVKDVGLYLKDKPLPFKHIIFDMYKKCEVPSESTIKDAIYKIEPYKLIELFK